MLSGLEVISSVKRCSSVMNSIDTINKIGLSDYLFSLLEFFSHLLLSLVLRPD